MEDKEVLQLINKWHAAYEILEEFSQEKCKGDCEGCGFVGYCNKALLLTGK